MPNSQHKTGLECKLFGSTLCSNKSLTRHLKNVHKIEGHYSPLRLVMTVSKFLSLLQKHFKLWKPSKKKWQE